jgi:hypothetical protein
MIGHRLQAVLLSLALTIATVQCLATCSVSPCDQPAAAQKTPVPPCHRHAPVKSDRASEACKSPVLVAENRTASIALADLQHFDLAAELTMEASAEPARAYPLAIQKFSPPPPVVLATVLRI